MAPGGYPHRPEGRASTTVRSPGHERPAQPRTHHRGPRRGYVRPGVPLRGAPGGGRPQARARDGRAQDRVRVPNLRPQRVRRVAVATRPRELRGRRARAVRRARRVPARACATRALRPRVASGHHVPDGRPAVARRVRDPGAARPPRAGPLRAGAARSSGTRWCTPRPTASAGPWRRRPRDARTRAVLVAGDTQHDLGVRGGTIGRSRDCDVVLDDRNVSRRHAEIRVRADGSWTVARPGLDERRARSTGGASATGARSCGRVTRSSWGRPRSSSSWSEPVLEPVSVGLKLAFLAVLYLFLIWVARSALKDLRRPVGAGAPRPPADATGIHPVQPGGTPGSGAARLVVESRPRPRPRHGVRRGGGRDARPRRRARSISRTRSRPPATRGSSGRAGSS